MRFPFLSENLHSLLEAIVESSEDAIFSKTSGGLVLSWNSGAEQLYGYRAHEMIGRSVSVLVPEDRRREWATILHRLAEGQRVTPFETVRKRKDGRLVDVSVTISPLRDATGKLIGASTIARDITERKQAEERQRLLDEASRCLVSSLDRQITLQEITQLVVPALADHCRIAVVDEAHQITALTASHVDPEKGALVRALSESSTDRPETTYGIQTLLQSGKPELLSIGSQDVLETAGTHPNLLRIVRELELQSYMAVPLIARGRTIGAITFSSVHPHRRYSEEDLSFAQELARRIALALENARLYEEAQEEIRVRKQVEAALRESEAQKGAVFETALDAILTMDHLGRIVEFNLAAEKTFGYTRQEVVGLAMVELIIPASLRERHRRGLAHYLATGEGPVMDRRIEIVALRKDGSEFPIELAVTRVPKEGDPFFTGTIRDITERKRAEERQHLLDEASRFLASALDCQISLHEIAHLLVPTLADYCRIAIVDEHHQIKDIAVHHRDPEKVALVQELYEHYNDRPQVTHGLQRILQTGQPELLSEVSESVRQVTREIPGLLPITEALGLHSYMGVPLLARDRVIGALTLSSVQPHRSYTPDDLSFTQELAHRIALALENARLHREAQAELEERKQAEEQQRVLQERILAMVTTDPVTALPNHRAMMAMLDQEVERAQRYQRCFSLLFLDLDHFKAFNDGYGHAAGDTLLCAFVGLVQSRLRGLDTLGRWGGEEFVVLMPELEGDEALALAEGVRAAVAASIFPIAGGIHLTCSIGLASYPVHAQEREGLLNAADRAMYGAKHFGRNQVRVAHDPAVHAIFNVSQPEGGREEATLVGVVEAMVALVEARDRLTGQHSHQVAALALQLALALGWVASEAQMLARAGHLHDIGKVAIPETILQKPGTLTAQEWEVIRTHPVVGADIVSHIPALRPLAPVIRAHHERWDGQGYPDQLAGEAIPLGARILAVADAYLTMIVDRPYQPARASAAALAELRCCAGSQFDTQVVEVLVRNLREPEKVGG